jgi:hypothetical protein
MEKEARGPFSFGIGSRSTNIFLNLEEHKAGEEGMQSEGLHQPEPEEKGRGVRNAFPRFHRNAGKTGGFDLRE